MKKVKYTKVGSMIKVENLNKETVYHRNPSNFLTRMAKKDNGYEIGIDCPKN